MSEKILVATAVTTKGLKGEVKLKVFAEDPHFIEKLDIFDANGLSYEIVSSYAHKGVLIVKMDGINHIDQAAKLVGTDFYAARDSFPEIENGIYYIDMIDWLVFNQKDTNIGRVLALDNFGAGEIVTIDLQSGGQVLIPLDDAVIDKDKKYLYVSDDLINAYL